jgi:hypothetical protein
MKEKSRLDACERKVQAACVWKKGAGCLRVKEKCRLLAGERKVQAVCVWKKSAGQKSGFSCVLRPEGKKEHTHKY